MNLEHNAEQFRDRVLREPSRDDWPATAGAFSSDPLAKEIIEKALRLRGTERERQSERAT
jgi:hypothetical protein